MATEIVVGVVTGVASSGLIWLAKSIWTNHVDPYLARVRYTGLDISGQWTAIAISDESAARFSMDVIQDAHSVSGNCVMEFYSASNEYRILQSITGDLWEGYLSIRYKADDRKITSYAVGLLKVSGGGVGLVGKYLYRDVNHEVVDFADISFGRGTSNPRLVIQFNEAAARFQAEYLTNEGQGNTSDAVGDAAPDQGANANRNANISEPHGAQGQD